MNHEDAEYMLRCVITKVVHARILVTAVDKRFVGDRDQWTTEAREAIGEARELLRLVDDEWEGSHYST